MSNLPFPLFHGTSLLFLDSIKHNGLIGAATQKFKPLEFLNQTYILSNDNSVIANSKEWNLLGQNGLANKEKIVQVIHQSERHYQHKDLYLTTSKGKAGGYAKNSGGELLQTCFHMIQLFEKYSITIPENILVEFDEIINLNNSKHEPIVLEVYDLPLKKLKSGEKGEPILEQFKEIAEHQIRWAQKSREVKDFDTIIEFLDKETSVEKVLALIKEYYDDDFYPELNFRIEGDIPWEFIREVL